MPSTKTTLRGLGDVRLMLAKRVAETEDAYDAHTGPTGTFRLGELVGCRNEAKAILDAFDDAFPTCGACGGVFPSVRSLSSHKTIGCQGARGKPAGT